MISYLFFFLYVNVIDTRHFTGGTITWMPVDSYDNSSSTEITIIQFYWWSYPTITCANNVPISTSGRSTQNTNLTCVTDCLTDGGYSNNPVNILTDCTSANSVVGTMTSQRSVNITLNSSAHFYLAYVGNAWAPLNSPTQSGLQWSIVTYINLRMRPDGFINTPPAASVISPQYVIVNETTQIQISVSDVNAGDDVRCRWSKYIAGYRRRRQSNEEERPKEKRAISLYESVADNGEIIHSWKKRANCLGGGSNCKVTCASFCDCSCPTCDTNLCPGATCTIATGCAVGATTIGTTTIDTPGTLKSTSSYPHRQAIDECGGICYPGSVPTDTTLSNCTLSFTGLISGTWYGIAIQVEDFINTTDTIPMSSVPIQFLIYVMPAPTCSNAPIIIPLSDCLEVTVGVSRSFNLYVLNLCDANTTNVTSIIVSVGISGIQVGNLTQSTTNSSLSYVTLTWMPQVNQIGLQQLCMVAYTTEKVQSDQYCLTFNVITSFDVCKTTTTTTTSSTATTSTISSTTTSTSTTTTTTITTATTSTATTTTSITTSRSLTSTTKTFTSTTTTAIVVVAATMASTAPGKASSWGLIAGISSLALPLALCACCCLYRLLWSPSARRRLQLEEEEENRWRSNYLTSSTESMVQTTTSSASGNIPIEVPRKSYQVYNIFSPKNNSNNISSATESEGSILVAIYNNTNARRLNSDPTHHKEQSLEMGNAWMQPSTFGAINKEISLTRRTALDDSSASKVSNRTATNDSSCLNRQQNNLINVRQLTSESTSDVGRDRGLRKSLYDFTDWSHLYLFGRKHNTELPRAPS